MPERPLACILWCVGLPDNLLDVLTRLAGRLSSAPMASIALGRAPPAAP
jgi:hypothetical protein